MFVRNSSGTQRQIKIENHRALLEIAKVDDEIWLATDGNGILILDKNLNFLRSLKRGPINGPKLRSNSIYDIYQGRGNEVWIATYGAGLQCLLADVSPFKNVVPEAANSNSLVASEGVSVFCDGAKIYFGTNYGLSVYDEEVGTYTNFSSKN